MIEQMERVVQRAGHIAMTAGHAWAISHGVEGAYFEKSEEIKAAMQAEVKKVVYGGKEEVDDSDALRAAAWYQYSVDWAEGDTVVGEYALVCLFAVAGADAVRSVLCP